MNAVIESSHPGTPAMREFNVSNHLLGDRAALDAAFDRDGYWFFRGVLDLDALAQTRAEYLEELGKLGVIDPGHNDVALYNGASLDDYPIRMGGPRAIDPLMQRYPRDTLVEHPQVKAFFEQIFGDEVFWVPNSEFQAVPPGTVWGDSRFNFVHADGPNNKGLPLKVCWIPLVPIDEETGGLAIAEGMHKPRLNDFPRPAGGIKETDIPPESWRRARFESGDVLIFSLETPHSGLANLSDRYFRLSMDIRGMPKSANVPVVGKVAAVDACAIAVDDDKGERHVFRIDNDTFCRIYRERLSGIPLTLEEIPQMLKIGDEVYVASDHGTATFIRPQH